MKASTKKRLNRLHADMAKLSPELVDAGRPRGPSLRVDLDDKILTAAATALAPALPIVVGAAALYVIGTHPAIARGVTRGIATVSSSIFKGGETVSNGILDGIEDGVFGQGAGAADRWFTKKYGFLAALTVPFVEQQRQWEAAGSPYV